MSDTLSLRVLVVDDSPSSLRTTSEHLRSIGCEVFSASEGEEALTMTHRHLPDVVVLDIILPKKTGFQVCREIKMQPATRHIQVILLSSKSQDADRFWGQRQGADAYLTKPVDPQELIAAVHSAGQAARRSMTEACVANSCDTPSTQG